jgi:hypothetical protein
MSMTMSGLSLADFPAERARLFLGFSGELHPTDRFPGTMRLVRRPLGAADVDHLESRTNQPRHKSSDMTGSADDYNARHGCSLRRPI